jgi:membrane protease subunit HflK
VVAISISLQDWQKRIASLFGGGGGPSSTVLLVIVSIVIGLWLLSGWYQVPPGNQGVVQRFGKHIQTVEDGWSCACPGPSKPSPRWTPPA